MTRTLEAARPRPARVRDEAGAAPAPLHGLVAAELTKLFSTYAIWGLAAGTAAAAGIAVAGPIATAAEQHLDLGSQVGVRQVLGAAGAGQIFAMALGILHTAGEFHHGLAARTFLLTPRRRRVVAAKAAAVGIVSLGYGLVAAATALAVALPWLAARDAAVSPLDGTVLGVLGGTLVGTVLYGLIGVGIGTVGRALAATLVAAIGWFLVIETALIRLWPEGGRFLAGGGAEALARAKAEHLLAPGWGALLLCGWAALAVAVAAWDIERRDVGS
jgi:ABC-2 type transport system permease protein